MGRGASWYGGADSMMRMGPPTHFGQYGDIVLTAAGDGVQAKWQRADGVWHSFTDKDANAAIVGLMAYVQDQWPITVKASELDATVLLESELDK